MFVEIENTVATPALRQSMNLNSIVHAFPEVRYRSEVFPSLIFGLKKPKTATLIFSSGKKVCTGAKSEEQSRQIVMNIVDDLRKKMIMTVEKPDIRIQNIVASGELDGTIDLDITAYSSEKTIYEPEQFPSLIYRIQKPTVLFLLSTTGKSVCM
jgi:transcription initiation factor TFIID TATA-box-binding protein